MANMEIANLTNNTNKVVEDFYAALAAKNLDKIVNQFSDDVDWFIAGEETLAPWLGQRNNRQEVKEFFQVLQDNLESVRFEIEHILADGDFAVATGELASRMLSTGVVFESTFSAHFTVRENQIIRYRFLEDSDGLVKALTK